MRFALRSIFVMLAAYPVGLGLGLLVLRAPHERRTTDESSMHADVANPSRSHEPENGEPAQGAMPDSTEWIEERLQAADRELRLGHWSTSLEYYRLAVESWQGPVPEDIRFRMALAWEASGHADRAIEAYRRLIAEAEDVTVIAGSKIGLAQAWSDLGRAKNSRSILWRFLLSDSAAPEIPAEIPAEASHLLAHLVDAPIENQPADLLAPDGLYQPPPPNTYLDRLGWLAPQRAAESTEAPLPVPMSLEHTPDAIRVRQLGKSPDETYISALLGASAARDVLQIATARANVNLAVSELATDRLSNSTVSLNISNVKLSLLMDALLDPEELVWTASGADVEIRACSEVDAPSVRIYHEQAADRLRRQSLLLYPESRAAGSTALSMANKAFQSQKHQLAIQRYRQLLLDYPRFPYRAETIFNLAKAQHASGATDEAINSFYRAVDYAVGGPVEPIAYLYAARLMVEDDRAEEAVRPLRRAVALSTSSDSKADAVLLLAGVNIATGKPDAAIPILMEHRDALASVSDRNKAAFLAAFARFNAADVAAKDRLSQPLIEALSQVDRDQFWTAQGCYLVASAYSAMGFTNRANELLISGIAKPCIGQLKEKMLYQLAANHYQANNIPDCIQTLHTLAVGREGRWIQRGKLLLLRASYDTRNDALCQELCEHLLSEMQDETSRREVLHVLGKSYQRQGKYHEATVCFRGSLPFPESSEDVAFKDESGRRLDTRKGL